MRKVFFGSTTVFAETFDVGSVAVYGVKKKPRAVFISARKLIYQALRSRATPYKLPLTAFVRENDGFFPASEQDVEIIVGSDIAGVEGTHLLNFFVGGWACGGHRCDGDGVFVVPWHGLPSFTVPAFDA